MTENEFRKAYRDLQQDYQMNEQSITFACQMVTTLQEEGRTEDEAIQQLIDFMKWKRETNDEDDQQYDIEY